LCCLLVICLFFSGKNSNAQSDSLRLLNNELADTTQIKRLDPHKALFYSAVFPGLGQIYNKKYWKLPIIYGGIVGAVMVVDYYQDIYVTYRAELYTYLDTGSSPSGRTESDLRYIVDKAKRQRDYWLIISGIGYLLQIVDAHVDAHLNEFKVNKEMKISLTPMIEQNMMIGRTTGFALTFKF